MSSRLFWALIRVNGSRRHRGIPDSESRREKKQHCWTNRLLLSAHTGSRYNGAALCADDLRREVPVLLFLPVPQNNGPFIRNATHLTVNFWHHPNSAAQIATRTFGTLMQDILMAPEQVHRYPLPGTDTSGVTASSGTSSYPRTTERIWTVWGGACPLVSLLLKNSDTV